MSLTYTSSFFFFNDTATTEIYTLSLHDALPISGPPLFPGLTGAEICNTSRPGDRKSTRLNSSHMSISYAVFCLKKKITQYHRVGVQEHSVVRGLQRERPLDG